MVKVKDLQGRSHTFTLNNGKTLRVFAYSLSKSVDNKHISKEIDTAVEAGIVSLVYEKEKRVSQVKNTLAPSLKKSKNENNDFQKEEKKEEGEKTNG